LPLTLAPCLLPLAPFHLPLFTCPLLLVPCPLSLVPSPLLLKQGFAHPVRRRPQACSVHHFELGALPDAADDADLVAKLGRYARRKSRLGGGGFWAHGAIVVVWVLASQMPAASAYVAYRRASFAARVYHAP
jgi:hypothetical protein